MAYELHIARQTATNANKVIPLEEWKAAVAATPGVRLCAPGFRTLTAPSGATLNIPINDGDTEVLFPDTTEWLAVFRWRKGIISFNARFDPGDSSHPVWAAAVTIASCLQAAIRGDDGESYDLQTGKINHA